MAISFVNKTNTGYPAATVSIVGTVPASVVNGDFLLWIMDTSQQAVPATPAGWTVGPLASTTANAFYTFYRIAASEPASYTATVASGRWSTSVLAYRGVDAVTPQDVAAPTAVVGTTIVQPPAITTVTANAWVVCIDSGSEAAGGVNTVWASSNTTLRVTISSTGATGVTATHGVGDVLKVAAGSFTGAFTATTTGTFVRSAAISMALRPDLTVAARARPVVSLWRPAVMRAATI